MSFSPHLLRRAGRLAGLFVLALTCTAVAAVAGNEKCDPGEMPDVIVADLPAIQEFGQVDGVRGFSIATTSCNVGTCGMSWYSDNNQHPVIAQNLFRLKNGRLEQIGQGWLKHGFFALADFLCATPENPCTGTPGNVLGVYCSDPYSTMLNGMQSNLGPKHDVNATTGVFSFPFPTQGLTGDAIYKRIQVDRDDLDASLNPGARYFIEGQYVAQDDAAARASDNNASYREVALSGPGNNLVPTGPTHVGQPAIHAWRAADPGVVLNRAVPDGLIWVGSRATDIGGGWWHYEYAIQNLTSHRSVGSFSVPLPQGANVDNIGFDDVPYHSGEPFDGTDWPDNGGQGLAVSWATESYAQNENANAIRWGTLYNFHFDADVPPVASTQRITLGYFRPGTPAASEVAVITPRLCDRNGVCDPGEDCSNCKADCVGTIGCCGDGRCDVGESSCSCFADCGLPPLVETSCADGLDDDCDSLTDCGDSDCCSAESCAGSDGDGDGFETCDCDDDDKTNWSPPGEVGGLLLAHDPAGGTLLIWDAPSLPGAVTLVYDVLRSGNPLNFMTSTTCLALPDPQALTAVDFGIPDGGQAFYYLVRADNGCENGGALGWDSNNQPRQGASCR